MRENIELEAASSNKSVEELLQELTGYTPEELRNLAEKHFEQLVGDTDIWDETLRERCRQSRLSEGTHKQREIAVFNFCDWYEETEQKYITDEVFKEFLRYYLEDKQYAVSTVKSRHYQIVSFVKESLSASASAEISNIDFRKFTQPYTDNQNQEKNRKLGGARPLKEHEKDLILEAAKTERLKTMVMTLWETGLRASELASLKISNIDLDDRTLTVKTAKRSDGHTRKLSFSIELKYQLRKYIEQGYRQKMAAAGRSDYLFPSHTNEQMHSQNLTQSIRNLAELAGVQETYTDAGGSKRAEVTVHSFRKAYGREMIFNGADITQVRDSLGHTKVGTTEEYLEFDDDEIAESDARYSPEN